MKACKRCHKTKPLTEFRAKKDMKDGHTNVCKTCVRAKAREWSNKRISNFNPSVIPDTKVCSNCKEEKSSSDFGLRRRNLDGLHNECRTCERLRISDLYSDIPWEDRVPDTKRCRKCQNTFSHMQFHKNTKRKDGLSDYCKSCSYIEQSRIKFGVTREWIVENMAKGCAVCHTTDNLHIDHCHVTGTVRGVLCKGCNHAEGNLGGDPARARALADYMEKHQTETS